jgi:hypothetical protein
MPNDGGLIMAKVTSARHALEPVEYKALHEALSLYSQAEEYPFAARLAASRLRAQLGDNETHGLELVAFVANATA